MKVVFSYMSKLAPTASDERYHHGNLRLALIAAAELELAASGPEKFSLRSCARRANVSHAAPAHHFGDAAGLLDALAALGFQRLGTTMQIEMDATDHDPANQLAAASVGYVRYAVENPHLFSLMFTTQFKSAASLDLIEKSELAFNVLVKIVAERSGTSPLATADGWINIAALWASVHGYAQLLIGSQMAMLTAVDFDGHRSAIKQIALRSVLKADGP